MDESLKEVLSKHWQVLVRYINPTESVINTLVEDKVLPSSMIDDVKKGSTRREKNEKLLKAIKLRGNISYRKFREAMMKCGQVFIADLLFEEDTSHAPLVEESDIASIPALKLSLSPEELKRVVVSLEAKVKYRVLKSDWRQNSFKRLEHLQSRTDDYRSQQAAQFNNTSFEAKVKGLEEEVSAKNDTIRTISLEVNLLNNEIANFLKRHKLTSRGHVSTIVSLGASGAADTTSSASHWTTGRFRHVESEISAIAQRLKGLLGEGTEAGDSGNSLSDVSHKTKQVQELIRELEAKLDSVTRDRDEALDLLQPGKKSGAESSAVQVVQKYLQTEQKNRSLLLRDIDILSRRLRGITTSEPNSGLRALRQSAVTGRPSPETVDYRFLSNHLSLINADAEHIAKKLSWKEVEVKALRSEVTALRKRFMCRKESPEFQHTEIELGD